MENLIDQSELARINTLKFGEPLLRGFLMKALKLDQINSLYAKNASKKDTEFIDAILTCLQIRVQFNEAELANIPKEGPFITVSNHPYGGIDGLLLLKFLLQVRPDFKVMANYLLQRLEPLSEHIIPVNNLNQRLSNRSSLGGLKKALTHLNEGLPLGFFPAGEVSSLHNGRVKDRKWQPSAIKIISSAEVPVIPIYFHGSNSRMFHIMGLINPMFRTARLPREFLNKNNKTVNVRIGKPISLEEQNSFENTDQFGRYLRTKVYALGSALEVKKYYNYNLRRANLQEEVVPETASDQLRKEIEHLEVEHLLFTVKNYTVFCAPANKIPKTLGEIGRLREITYRDVGEGTNRKTDSDEFDLYFHHLFIWDEEKSKIVGGYRIGKGKEVMEQFGVSGFYINKLFKIRSRFHPVLRQSLELGRSFIVKDYQRRALPLFLLWKGILLFLMKNPDYRYLIGPVSISNRFSELSKSFMIEFIRTHYFNHFFSTLIKPRKSYHVAYGDLEFDLLEKVTSNNLNKLDRFIQEIEPDQSRLPVLLKKYLQLNARVIGFNLDPKFSNALDGLILLDLYEVPAEVINSLAKDLHNDAFLERYRVGKMVQGVENTPQY